MEAMVNVACAFADHKNADIRLEAAIAKYCCSETVWKMYGRLPAGARRARLRDAKSLYDRGEHPIAVETGLRDARIPHLRRLVARSCI